MKRQRGRSRRSGGGQNNNINRHFESNGPDVKIRGSAQQVLDKYLQYAREAQTNGDRVKSEAYFQHAEHYQRTLATMMANQKPKRDRDDNRDDNRNRDPDQDHADSGEAEVETAADTQAERDRDRDSDGDGDRKSSGSGGGGRKSDPLRVIGEDDGPQAEGEAKPKRARRKTYKKRTGDEAEGASSDGADEDADGVMKTLSRGRKSSKPKDTAEDGSGAEDAPEEAAAE